MMLLHSSPVTGSRRLAHDDEREGVLVVLAVALDEVEALAGGGLVDAPGARRACAPLFRGAVDGGRENHPARCWATAVSAFSPESLSASAFVSASAKARMRLSRQVRWPASEPGA